MAKREYVPGVSLPSGPFRQTKTAEEKKAEEQLRLDRRAIAIDTKNRINGIWQTLGDAARAEFFQAKEMNPDSITAIERKALEDTVEKWSRQAQEKRVGVDLEKVAADYGRIISESGDPRLARFAAGSARLQTDRLDEDFVRNTSREVLARFVAEEMDKAGRAYSKETRSTRPGGTSPLDPKTTTIVPKVSLSEAGVEELKARRVELAREAELADLNLSLSEMESRGANPADLIRGRERLKALSQAYGVAIPSPDKYAGLKLKLTLLDQQIKRGGFGGYKLGGGKGEKSAPSDSQLMESMAIRRRIQRGGEVSEVVNDLIREYSEANPDATKKELRKAFARFYKDALSKLDAGTKGQLQVSRATAAGRVARGVDFAKQYENELVTKASDIVKGRIGANAWKDLSEVDKLVAVEKEIQSIEKNVRGEKLMGVRKIRDAAGNVIGTEDIFGTPADLETLRQTFAKRPSLYIDVTMRGGQKLRRKNPTFVLANGQLILNPEYVQAELKGLPTEGIPRTLFARAVDRWEAQRGDLQEASYYDRVLIDPNDPKKGYVPDMIKVAGRLIATDTPEGRMALREKNMRASFYANGRVVDPTNRIISAARKRVKEEARALGLAVGQTGTKDEKQFARDWIESRVPLMVGVILAEPGQYTLKELSLAKLLSDSIKNKELILTKSHLAELEKVAPKAEKAGGRKVEVRARKISEAAAFRKAVRRLDEEYGRKAVESAGPAPSVAAFIKDPRAAAEYSDLISRLRTAAPKAAKGIKKKIKAFYKKTQIDPGYKSALDAYQQKIQNYMDATRQKRESEIQSEYLAILRGERGAREGLRVRKAEGAEPLEGLGGFTDDIGGTITTVAVGGLVAFALFKLVSGLVKSKSNGKAAPTPASVAPTKTVAGLYGW